MKIVYIVTRMDERGGVQIHLRDLARALTPMGHEVHVIAGAGGPLTDDLTATGMATCHIVPHMVRSINPFREPLALFQIYRLLRQIRPDLVSTHSSKAGVLGRLAAFLARVPAIFTVHGWAFTDNVPGAKRALYRAIEKIMAPLAARIVTVSDYDRALGLSARLARPDKVITVHNGMPDIALPPRILGSDGMCRLIMVARFAEQKDHELLVRALAPLTHLDWTLQLVGNGDSSAVQTQINALGLQDRITILGQRADVAELLAATDIFLLITHWEGFPRSILEAMRAGLPVIATAVAGIPESVVDGVTGLLVPHADERALSLALARLITDREARVGLGAAARARYEQYFTFDRMRGDTIAVYESVLGRPVDNCGEKTRRALTAPPPTAHNIHG